jgi:hypothetical protein
MNGFLHSRNAKPFNLLIVLGAFVGLSGCFSSRSRIEDGAKTPHHPLQQSRRTEHSKGKGKKEKNERV